MISEIHTIHLVCKHCGQFGEHEEEYFENSTSLRVSCKNCGVYRNWIYHPDKRPGERWRADSE